MKITRLRLHASGPNILLAALLILIEVASSTNSPPATIIDEDDASLHFSDERHGNAVWVVDEIALPWVGSYEYLSNSKSAKTVLMIVADSSTGKTLAECSIMRNEEDYNHWQRFQWALGPESLQCTVSQTNSSAAIFQKSAVPRSYSIRIQASHGPTCMRDLLIQNERPHGCPPRLARNRFSSTNLLCGCPDDRDVTIEESTDEEPAELPTAAQPPFPRFEFGQATVASSDASHSGRLPNFTISPCANHHCKNGGTCVVTVNGTAACLCDLNYMGDECQFRSTPIVADPCANVPCQNGGKCRATGNDGIAVCDCTPGWEGLLCETKIIKPLCSPECANGECIRDENTGKPICECTQGFIGVNCNIIDVCLGDAACSLYGPLAKCVLDEETYALTSATLKNASYECRCPHPVDGQYVDCLQLHLSSTTVGTTEETDGEDSVFEAGSTSMTGDGEATPTPTFPLTGIPVRPKSGSSQPPLLPFEKKPDTGAANRVPIGPFSGHPTPTPAVGQNQQPGLPFGTVTQTPFTWPPNEPFQPNQGHTVFPIAPNPHATASSTGTTFIFPPTAPTPAPTANTEHQPTHSIAPMPIGLGEDEDDDELEMHPHQTAAAVTITPFPTPSSIETSEPERSTTAASSHETLHQLITNGRPIAPEIIPNTEKTSGTTPTKTTPTTTKSTSISTSVTPKVSVAVPIATTQSTLPFWMLQKSTSTMSTTTEEDETTDNEEDNENLIDSEEGDFTTTETTSNSSEAITTTTMQKTTNATTTETDDVMKNGSQRTQRSSTVSWVVCIIALIILFLLLLATALFVLRYIKQSRKLHGKYNPAREEHNMSAAYAMPMSHIAKEERLI